jgi:hypothetical protein
LVEERNAERISTLAINCQPVLVNVVVRLADELLFVVDYSASAPYGNRVVSTVDGNRHIVVLQDVADVTESGWSAHRLYPLCK